MELREVEAGLGRGSYAGLASGCSMPLRSAPQKKPNGTDGNNAEDSFEGERQDTDPDRCCAQLEECCGDSCHGQNSPEHG